MFCVITIHCMILSTRWNGSNTVTMNLSLLYNSSEYCLPGLTSLQGLYELETLLLLVRSTEETAAVLTQWVFLKDVRPNLKGPSYIVISLPISCHRFTADIWTGDLILFQMSFVKVGQNYILYVDVSQGLTEKVWKST